MDPTLWLTHRSLPHRDRARWTRSFLEDGCVPPDLLEHVRAARDATRRDVEEWAHRGRRLRMRWLTPLDREYPRAALGRLHDPPGVLFVRGDVSLLARAPSVAVVGARRGTPRGRRVARSMGADLARADVAVVSGLALGIDAAAHAGTVDEDGRGIAVLAGGLDRVHPTTNATLGEQLLRRGLLVSENPPGHAPRPYEFVARNRIIAALANALVVVEASERSGALTTIDFATQVGTDVMIVPGPVDCPHARGTLARLREGATCVRHATDVLESLGLEAAPRAAGPLGLGDVPETVAELARRTGLPLTALLARLGEEELMGRVERVGPDRWVAAASDLPSSPDGT